MANLATIIKDLELTVLTESLDFEQIEITEGYTSDLLSCVMAGASNQGVWVTLQAHHNIIAVAALLDLNAVIITEGAQPDAVTIEKANEEGISLLGSKKTSFFIVGKLWEAGVKAS